MPARTRAKIDGSKKVPVLQTVPRRTTPAAQQVSPFFLSDVDIPLDLGNRLLADQRTNVRSGFATVAELERTHAVDETREEFVVNAILHHQPARRRASLPRRPERAPQHALEREIEIRVVEHEHRVLASHLERQALVHPAARLADDSAGLGRPGK